MMANVIWNMKNSVSGMVPVSASRETSSRNALSSPPMTPCTVPPSENVSE
jgi:hypothetical protein